MPDLDRRQELADFLKTRRDRLQPETVGFNRSTRRRTPGLRREEVAMLAGISPEWYTWLEQARDINVSQETLEKIAEALRLEPSETEYMLLLAGYSSPAETGKSISVISPQLQHVLERIEFMPAYVVGRRWDILGWNEPSNLVFGDISNLLGIERNCLWQTFHGLRRKMTVDWVHCAKAELDTFRVSIARYEDYTCPWINQFIETLKESSPEFRDWWLQHDVKNWNTNIRHFEHPQLGRLSFEHNAFQIADRQYSDLKLITCVPLPETDTLAKIKANY